MKAIILTGNSFRHRYFVSEMVKYFDVAMVLTEEKKNYYSNEREKSPLIREHFCNLSKYEKIFFEQDISNDIPKMETVSDEGINHEEWVSKAKELVPDIILLYGTSILKEPWLNNFDGKIINLHLGLSPFYRGSATLFWPFVNNELEYVGATIHLAVKKVDAGEILARVRPDIELRDNYYTISNKTIKKSVQRMPSIVIDYLDGKIALKKQDLSIGKRYKRSDFSELALGQALDIVKDGITEDQLKMIREIKI